MCHRAVARVPRSAVSPCYNSHLTSAMTCSGAGQELGGGAGVVHHRQAVAGSHQWAGRPGRHLPRQLLQSDWNLFP